MKDLVDLCIKKDLQTEMVYKPTTAIPDVFTYFATSTDDWKKIPSEQKNKLKDKLKSKVSYCMRNYEKSAKDF